MKKTYSLGIVGGGLVGLTATLKLARLCQSRGERLAFIAPQSESEDQRTTAMLMPSIETLEQLEVWAGVADHTAPLKTMRLIDGSSRILRAPTVNFHANELDLEAFGYNVPNAQLSKLLEAQIAKCACVDRFDAMVQSADIEEDAVCLTLTGGDRLELQFAIAADGRNSLLRKAAGIATRRWHYPQSAIALNFTHSMPHNWASTEFHTETGPFTQVPLPASKNAPYRSGLVWVVRPEQVDEILDLPLPDISHLAEVKMHSFLGKVEVEEKPQAFPLEGMVARQFAKGRIALVGETAHVIPPIGAQGFNLGVRDVSELTEIIQSQPDFSNCDLISQTYDTRRKADVGSRSAGIDVMNRSLLTDFLPVQMARAVGLSALQSFPWLRRMAMQQGLGNPIDNRFSRFLQRVRPI